MQWWQNDKKNEYDETRYKGVKEFVIKRKGRKEMEKKEKGRNVFYNFIRFCRFTISYVFSSVLFSFLNFYGRTAELFVAVRSEGGIETRGQSIIAHSMY